LDAFLFIGGFSFPASIDDIATRLKKRIAAVHNGKNTDVSALRMGRE
jgi:hypothetical protein